MIKEDVLLFFLCCRVVRVVASEKRAAARLRARKLGDDGV